LETGAQFASFPGAVLGAVDEVGFSVAVHRVEKHRRGTMDYPDHYLSQRGVARLAGVLYLAYIVTFAASTFIQGKPIKWDDAAATANAITASQGIFRLGVSMELIAALLFLLSAWSLYMLFKPVSKDLALLFLLLNLVGVGIECVDTLIRFAALMLDTASASMAAFRPDQLQTLGLIFLKVSSNGNMVCALFYAVWLFPLGFLAIKSRLLPKVFGILLILDGISLMICFVQTWFYPGYEKWMYPLYPVMFIAEFGLGVWLAIVAVRASEPKPALTN
jgi:hypothetical protein